MAVDLSTIGIKFLYGVETEAGEKPTKFTQIPGCVAIGGISLSMDTIDTTPLEESVRRYAEGLKDTGGAWSLTFNIKNEFKTLWTALQSASETGKAAGLATWAEVLIPGMDDAFFVTFTPGEIPMPEIGVSSAFQGEISNVINEYKGLSEKVDAA